jgi:phosphorylase/glycogen(starch) synthase
MAETLLKPDYLFEVSWEVCNQIGGMHTVVATKALSMVSEYGNNYITIGPDLVRETVENSEFEIDDQLYAGWRRHAEISGFRIKLGRWQVPGNPIVILVDFSDFLSSKDEIFSNLWEEYRLDSLSGQWDYIEPALFGYATGKIIENFVLYNLTRNETSLAHFHEWMSGAGILYLKKSIPQVGTVFTTHATVLGRTLAASNRLLYDKLSGFIPEEVAREYKVVSKQSLEKISANEADIFTTVSDITGDECKHFLGRDIDLLTPNGFEGSIVPGEPEFSKKRLEAREKMLQVASALVDENLPGDTFILATSGRYEFKNKGIDLFIDAISKLRETKPGKQIVAFLFNPSNHYGPRKDLQEALLKDLSVAGGSPIITHYLHDAEMDPISKRIHQYGFENKKGDKIKLIYVPCYLNGDDGIFNLSYYDILIGCDQTVFASYYEPWGYTPLESLAYGVPTVTTSLTGVGRWIKEVCESICDVITIIERNDTNEDDVITEIMNAIQTIYNTGHDKRNLLRNSALQLSQKAYWSLLLNKYKIAYDKSLKKVSERSESFVNIEEKQSQKEHEEIVPLGNEPRWKRIIVRAKLPRELEKLQSLAENIWWTWDDDAQELFETIDSKVWLACDFTPAILFEQIPHKRLMELSHDEKYLQKLNAVHDRFIAYMEGKKDQKAPLIAYFSMEFGFHDSLKLYSGGLGILAGDYLKEASDAKVNLIGIGILYRFGYFSQMLSIAGEQQANYDYQHFSKIPVRPVRSENGDFLSVKIMLPGRVMHARIWNLKIGRIEMYLLDTDFEDNSPEDRVVSHQLYGGDRENRLKQELLLGVGGIRALEALCIHPDLYHSNEGHSAFSGLERIRILMRDQQLAFPEAQEIVRASTLFTTHTPVPAGHDHFDEDMLRKYLGHYPDRLKINWDQFMAIGRANPNDWNEKFNMSYLAAHLAQEVNGVSMLHGAVTREMFAALWPGFLPQELHIGYVTNGVHWSTWTAKPWKELYNRLFNGNFVDNQSNPDFWKRIYDVDNREIWELKQSLRKRLITAVKERFKENWIKRHEDPKQIVAINNTLSENALTVVFARRFATYKRAHLLFNNIERLAKIVNNPKMPIQFIFAGKAHPADKAGQALIKMIVEISKRPEFLGKILFLQNYSIGLAKLLVSGADIWLNTPTRPLEASGTSGEKAVMNGTLHFSVLDGWWVEGYQPDAGWALTNERTYENQEFQDNLDAEIIYSFFENEVLPSFYDRDEKGISAEWVSFIKNTIAGVSPKFTTRRMINDYINQFYNRQYERSKKINANDYNMALGISSWKKRIARSWDNIDVIESTLFESSTEMLDTGTEYSGRVVLELNDIDSNQVGVELIVTEKMHELVSIQQFKLVKAAKGRAVFEAKVINDRPGTFIYGIRVYPVNEFLPHRQDFGLIRWI